MEIGQRSINFGVCDSKQPKERTILINNRSAAPLLYQVAKTGRHASFDVQIRNEDRLGCVGPLGSRQIRFLFRPSLAGAFYETLTVHNVQDPSDEQQVVIKAEVRKSISFHLTAPTLDFGLCSVGKLAPVEHRIVISNIARGARHFVICCSTEVQYEGDAPAPYRAQASLSMRAHLHLPSAQPGLLPFQGKFSALLLLLVQQSSLHCSGRSLTLILCRI